MYISMINKWGAYETKSFQYAVFLSQTFDELKISCESYPTPYHIRVLLQVKVEIINVHIRVPLAENSRTHLHNTPLI